MERRPKRNYEAIIETLKQITSFRFLQGRVPDFWWGQEPKYPQDLDIHCLKTPLTHNEGKVLLRPHDPQECSIGYLHMVTHQIVWEALWLFRSLLYRSLWPVASIILRVSRGIVGVVSSTVSFSNHRPCLPGELTALLSSYHNNTIDHLSTDKCWKAIRLSLLRQLIYAKISHLL